MQRSGARMPPSGWYRHCEQRGGGLATAGLGVGVHCMQVDGRARGKEGGVLREVQCSARGPVRPLAGSGTAGRAHKWADLWLAR